MVMTQGDLEGDPIQGFCQQLGIKFEKPWLLRRALTHRSYLNEHPEILEDNERLEFLGDAVLDFLVAAWLYDHFPEMSEGYLTRYRAALVGNEQLAEFSRQINLGDIMQLGKGETEGGGRDRSVLLGSTFEALVGALFLDQGIEAVQSFLEPLLHAAVAEILNDRKDQDPKSMLQEWSQAHGFGAPVYQTINAYGPDHAKIFIVEVLVNGTVHGRGEGPSKQAAAKLAAKMALEALEMA